jgi:hypothetical protein
LFDRARDGGRFAVIECFGSSPDDQSLEMLHANMAEVEDFHDSAVHEFIELLEIHPPAPAPDR